MANKARLTVRTDVGTFTRTTARTYTHLVVVGPQRAEWLEARRQEQMTYARQSIAKHQAAILDNGAAELAAERARVIRNGSSVARADEWIEQIRHIHSAEAQAEYLATDQATLAALEAQGPITADEGKPGILGWCGRLDLARKLANSAQAEPYRYAHIYDVATGERVR